MHRMRSTGVLVGLGLALGASGAGAESPVPSAVPTTIGQPADDGARIVAVDVLDPRMRDLTIESPSVGRVKVRLLLPADFEAQPDATWPVLYLLHGSGGSHAEWTDNTDVESLTAPTDLLVVMPDAGTDDDGTAGWYTDWDNAGKGGPPAWETFHMTELPQLLERDWQAGRKRAIAGLSMGGYGAMLYAAHRPTYFTAAASYSGVLDLKVNPDDFSDPAAVTRWGDPVAEAANWDDHDPIKLVSQLKDLPLYIAYGDGDPGPLDASGTEQDGLEQWIGQGGDLFVAALRDAGGQPTVDAYGPGTHSWPYWERDLHSSLPMLLHSLGEDADVSSTPSGSATVSPAPSAVPVDLRSSLLLRAWALDFDASGIDDWGGLGSTLDLSDGRFTGGTGFAGGCDRFEGTYASGAHERLSLSLGLMRMGCIQEHQAKPEARYDIEAPIRIVEGLAETRGYILSDCTGPVLDDHPVTDPTITCGTLTLVDGSTRPRLVYRAY